MKRILDDIREMVSEQVQYRELLYQMTLRDLLLRYKQSVMGFGWAVFMPLVNTAVFSVIFTRVAPLQTGLPYPLFAFSGLLAWNFFAASLRLSVISLTSNAVLVAKIFFPREILPFSSVIVCAIDFGVGFLVLIAMMVYYHITPTPTILFLPVVIAVQVLFTTGVALILSMANLFYRDVKYLFEVLITVWMFATSVVYPSTSIGGRLGIVLRLNPMTAIIDGYRDVLLLGRLPDAVAFSVVTIFSFAVVALAWLIFHRAEFQFAENV
jgi:lipopolysaccharide transport system permease protein